MSTSFVDAKEPQKQNPTEKQEVSVVIFINVIFSLLSNKGSRKKNDNGMIDSTDLIGAMADLVKEHPCYHANISIDKNPDKIYAYECYVPCQDLFFNDNGDCIDPIGSFSKILYACMELDDYLGEQVFPSESKIQVCINVMGFESIEDLTWGFAFLADACCPNNVEDKMLNELIMDDYEPFFVEYIKSGWKVNVTYISLLESGIVYEVYDKKKTSAVSPSNMIEKNNNKKENNAKPKNNNIKNETNVDVKGDVDKDKINNNNIEETPITLKGYVSKTHVDLSSFLSFDHIIDTIPPFGAIRFLDRLTGVDKIEKRITDNTNKSIDAFINGDSEGGWKYLKEAGGASLDYIHKRLDVLAYAPVIGSVAGVVDGWIYTVQEGFAFHDGDWDKGNELKTQALYAYFGAVPLYKIFKFAKPVWKSGKAITEGSKYIVKADKAMKAYKEANMAKKALKGATKAVRKPAISNRYAKKRAMREAEDLLNKAKSDPEYIKALEEYGIKYEDAIAGYRANFWEKIRVLYGKKTPVADFVETFIKQMGIPNSATREAVRNMIPQND